MDLELYHAALAISAATLFIAVLAIAGARKWKRSTRLLLSFGLAALLAGALCVIAALVLDTSARSAIAGPKIYMNGR